MGVVVTFLNYRPPVRYDDVPWTQARIEEAGTATGDYAALETVTFSPVDLDPTNPLYRSFTTELGSGYGYWYRVVYLDASGDSSQPTEPVQNPAAYLPPADLPAPTVSAYATVAELARVLRIRTPSSDQQIAMQRVLDAAALEIDNEIGLVAPYPVPAPALVVEVNLERAVEHWQQQESPFGIVGLTEAVPTRTGQNTWERHAQKLAPLKQSWGLA